MASLVIAACGDDGAPIGDGSSSTAADTGPAVTDASTDDPGMTGPVATDTTAGDDTTAGPVTDDTAGETAGETEGSCDAPPAGEACQEPGPTTIGWQLRIDGAELQEQELTGTCTVLDVADDGTTSTIALDCMRFQAELDVSTTDPHHVPTLAPGDEVELHASAQFEDEANVARYLTLRRFDALELGAFDASEFTPPPGFDYEPVALEVVATDCPQRPTECVLAQDAALAVGFDDQMGLVYGGQDVFVGQLTSYRVMTGEVERIQCFPDCGYSYAEWFVQGLVFRIPEG